MTVRAAKFVDMPSMVGVMERSHRRSRYADCTFDEIEAKQLLVRCIQRHGHQNYMGSLVLVSENGGEIRGLIVGILDQVYPALKELKATDLLILMDQGADARDFPEMLAQLIEWADANPKVVEVLLGVTDAVIDWKLAAPYYEKAGFEQCGGIFRLSINRSEMKRAANV